MQLRLNSTLRQEFGQRSLTVSTQHPSNLHTVIEQLALQQPELAGRLVDEAGGLRSDIVLFLNGRNILFMAGLDTDIGPDDTVDVFPKTGVQRAFASLEVS